MKSDWLKTALIVLSSVALALVILTVIVIFYPSGSYEPVALENSATGTTFSSLPSSTANISSTASTSIAIAATSTGGTAEFASDYTAPYPVTWSEGGETFSLIGAAMQDGQLTLTLAIQMGNIPECVPLNLRIITDETGAQKAPDSPAGSAFVFPDTQSCNGTPGATYSEPVTFTIDNIASPFLMTTGGASNIFFTVATDTNGGIDVTLPSTSG